MKVSEDERARRGGEKRDFVRVISPTLVKMVRQRKIVCLRTILRTERILHHGILFKRRGREALYLQKWFLFIFKIQFV